MLGLPQTRYWPLSKLAGRIIIIYEMLVARMSSSRVWSHLLVFFLSGPLEGHNPLFGDTWTHENQPVIEDDNQLPLSRSDRTVKQIPHSVALRLFHYAIFFDWLSMNCSRVLLSWSIAVAAYGNCCE